MEQLILALSPFVVSIVASLVKKVPMVALAGYRKTTVRVLVALFSFGAVVGTAALNGVQVDMVSVETFVQALLTFLGSTGVYFFFKKK